MHIDISVFEAFLYVLGLFGFLTGRTIYGTRNTALFFLGVFVLAGFNEHVNCFLGHYNYLWHRSRDLHYFSKYAHSLGGNWLWIGVLPGYFFPAWFFACICAYTITGVVLPKASTNVKAVATAIQIILIGLVAENLGQINQWWEYTAQGKSLTFWDGVWGGVFVYYFCWITSLVLVFERTIIQKGDFAFLRTIEGRLFRQSTLGVYCFRLIVFSALSALVTQLFDRIVLQPLAT